MSAVSKNNFFDRDKLIQEALVLSQTSKAVKGVSSRLVKKGLKTEQAETLTRVFYASMKSDEFHPLFMTLLNEVPVDQVKSVKGRLIIYVTKNMKKSGFESGAKLLDLVTRVQSVPKQQSIFTPARVGLAIAATTLAATAFYYASNPGKAMIDLMASNGTSTLDPLSYCPVDSAPVVTLSDWIGTPFVTNQVYSAVATAATVAAKVVPQVVEKCVPGLIETVTSFFQNIIPSTFDVRDTLAPEFEDAAASRLNSTESNEEPIEHTYRNVSTTEQLCPTGFAQLDLNGFSKAPVETTYRNIASDSYHQVDASKQGEIVVPKDSSQQLFQDPQLPRGGTPVVAESIPLTKQDTIVFPAAGSQPSDSNVGYAPVSGTILALGVTVVGGTLRCILNREIQEETDQNNGSVREFLTTAPAAAQLHVSRDRLRAFARKNEGKLGITRGQDDSFQFNADLSNVRSAIHNSKQRKGKR